MRYCSQSRGDRRPEMKGRNDMKNRYKVETRGNSYVVVCTDTLSIVRWFNSNRQAPEQRHAAVCFANELNSKQ
jgi:hypothetical protein